LVNTEFQGMRFHQERIRVVMMLEWCHLRWPEGHLKMDLEQHKKNLQKEQS